MRILIVEDDHRIAQAIKKGLEQEKMTTDVVYDGQEGYDLATTEPYDCIILDRMLPGMNGLTVCRTLRDEGNHTPIILLSAKGQTYDKIDGLNCGADDYLSKPFSFDELVARIKALIRRPKKMTADVLTYQDLTLNTSTFEVTRSGKTIQLSSKEFSLLSYLMRHPDTILSKGQCIEYVWNFDSSILPNTVEAVVKNLRKKIDAPYPVKLIQTVRGFGYKIGITIK